MSAETEGQALWELLYEELGFWTEADEVPVSVPISDVLFPSTELYPSLTTFPAKRD